MSVALRMRRLPAVFAVVVVGVCALGVLARPVPARAALAPWWGINSAARPTSLQSLNENEVQEFAVTATGGDVLWLEPVEFRFAVFPYNAMHEEVQAALEGLYGAGNVEVSGGPVGKPAVVTGSDAYVVTFKGTLGGTPVAPMPASFAGFACLLEVGECLVDEKEAGEPEPPPGSVEISELSKGAPDGQIVVTAENLGDAPTSGPISIADTLPAGLTATSIKGIAGGPGGYRIGNVPGCKLETLTCTFETFEHEEPAETVPGVLPPFEQIEIVIQVQVNGAHTGALNTATVTGGGAAARTATHPIEIETPRRFGIDEFSLVPEEQGGTIDTQAGSHPFQITSTVTLDSQTPDSEGNPRTVALPKDVIAELPPGFIGNPTPFAQCTDQQFAKDIKEKIHGTGEPQPINACPAASALGVATVTFNEPNSLHFGTVSAPLFNMVPRRGEPARFGFKVGGIVSAFLDTSIRSGGDYGVNVGSLNIPQIQWLLGVKLTFWGTPGVSEHDHQRGWDCLEELGPPSACPETTASSPPPFLVMPSSCSEPFRATLHASSWGASGHPEEVATPFTYTLPEAIDGCNKMPFSPQIRVTPDGTAASTPTGLDVDVHVPQDAVLNHESLGESAVKDITVALPQGVSINPSGGDGLEACSEALVGFGGFSELPGGGQIPSFSGALPDPLQPGINFCSDASKIGTVEIASPLLPAGQHVKGSIYLATQDQNPFGSLIAAYIVAEDPISGVLVKIPGEVHLTESGQLISTFANNPQLAFEDAEVHFFGGERAPLGTPSHCGPYTTTATFTPWSGNQPATSQSTFEITSGPHGSPCPPQSLPFAPTLTGGAINNQAGAFGPLSTTIGREDGNQDLRSVSLLMPPGLSGILAGVPLCHEAEANAGTCPQQSQIGQTTVSAGLGSDPVSVTGGRVYITEGYEGAPFGLSIVNPVKAGPFDLENTTSNHPPCDCIVVRAKIEVDPTTAQLRVTTDREGAHAIPRMIQGIPVQIQHVNVLIDRQGFTFNPTNCAKLQISGSIESHEGQSSPVSVPFQAANCATLHFKPAFQVTATGKNSKAGGAGLSVKLSYPKAPFGSQANIAQVKVDLPRQLPSRLTTLQKACPAKTYEADPQSCPGTSIVGHAKVITPLLPVPLTGPAYFVSHGNEAFPSLTMLLKGYGVTVELVGSTFIKKGITSSTFKATPDVPFDTFELDLPQGPYSALAANADLCHLSKTTTVKKRVTLKRKGRTIHATRKVKQTTPAQLLMPTFFKAQNGAEVHQSTRISVSGCGKVAKKKGRGKGKAKTGTTGRRGKKG
jgi:hypothetical protein